ncbi:L-proline glycine betaine ABC transport system permease protein ProV [Serinicoccus hydrothermalis]|uniref:L-proline glycine betaine ABC transport system permease protein ProV n=1 Tax=Serinicoccus hydrothermalis TaxID=1758689 RepID=A0A1B1NF07_9MICO|nr:betaine/proline/choline family ABC transporter ATP-binding protein [Serinicoccus hydrothermalis]ANS79983.1 L-proline glycine betaine ABC transport system permease protein ProV [Serinicoccus hydrothermalis]
MASISAEKLYKIFGRRPERGVDALEKGATRADLRQQDLTPAVIDASFDVKDGEIFVVMGLSGSGKSTLIRMVNGLLEPTSGSVSIDGDDVTRLTGDKLRAVRREKVSMVFQHFALLPHRTVGENAAYALEVSGTNRAEREKRADRALEMVGLGGWGGSMPGELSGGMRQRVGLARALASGTDIMLMDEAFSALDPLIRRDMQDQLIELQQELDKTILFITHDLNEAMRLGDRIAMMRDGRIEQIGTAQEILNDPVNRYVADFVQDVDRSRVLTASDIMTSVDGASAPSEGAVVPADATLADLFSEATEHEQLLVQDASGQTVGTIRRTDLLAALHTRSGEGATATTSTTDEATTGDLQPTGGAA